MKKKILAACVALVCFAGCDERSPKQVSPVPPKVEQAPILTETSPSVLPMDGGSVTEAEHIAPSDPLALVHEHSGQVDHLARAQQLLLEGDPEDALTEARRALHHQPNDEEALELVARLARSRRPRSLAVAAFERLAQVRSEDAVPLIRQARLLVSMGEHDQAIQVGTQAIERDGENPECYQAVGRAQLSKGRLSEAIAMFQKAVELAPAHGYALNNLGFAYLRANENQKAVEVLSRAAQVLPNVAYVHNNLGVALERTGRVDEAKAEFASSTQLSPKYVKAQINSARVAKVTPLDSTDESSTDVQESETTEQ